MKSFRSSILASLLILLLLLPAHAQTGFRDVSSDAWYASGVSYVSSRNLMSGVGDGRFDPEGSVTRGMIVTILHRMAGTPKPGRSAGFADVAAGSYYAAAVNWAAENAVVTGTDSNHFAPDSPITREQLAAILFRYCKAQGDEATERANLSAYADASQISAYAKDAMSWANANGYLTGVSEDTLLPGGTTTRAQAAAIIMRYHSVMKPIASQEPAQTAEEQPKQEEKDKEKRKKKKHPPYPQSPR